MKLESFLQIINTTIEASASIQTDLIKERCDTGKYQFHLMYNLMDEPSLHLLGCGTFSDTHLIAAVSKPNVKATFILHSTFKNKMDEKKFHTQLGLYKHPTSSVLFSSYDDVLTSKTKYERLFMGMYADHAKSQELIKCLNPSGILVIDGWKITSGHYIKNIKEMDTVYKHRFLNYMSLEEKYEKGVNVSKANRNTWWFELCIVLFE